MIRFLTTYFSELAYLFNEMAPWLLFGLVFAGLLKAYFPQKQIIRYLGKSNLRSVVNASLLGVPMPLCSCGVIPTGISFYKNGASNGATNSFLISTPQTGVDSIFATYSMLGWPFAILRPIVAFVTGIFGGLLTNLFIKDQRQKPSIANPKLAELKFIPTIVDTSKNAFTNSTYKVHKIPNKKVHSLIGAANYAFIELLQDISKWLIIGFLVAALLSVLIPDDFFSQFIGSGFLEILIILGASVPLYVCATGSIPIAAVLLMKGVSPGAALVFMMAGPATNLGTIAVIGKTMGKKSLIIYLVAIIGGAIFFGLLTNWLIPAEFILSKMNHLMVHGEAHEMLPKWIGIGSSIVLIVLIVSGYFIQRYKKNRKINIQSFQIFKVEGMTCSHCESSIVHNLQKLEGVNEVIADRYQSEVRVRGSKVDVMKMEKVITEMGYKFKQKTP